MCYHGVLHLSPLSSLLSLPTLEASVETKYVSQFCYSLFSSPIMSVFSPLYTSPNMVSIIWLFEHLYLIIVITILYIKNYMCIYAFVFLCLFFLCVYTVIRFLTLLITPDTRLLLDTNTDSDSPSL